MLDKTKTQVKFLFFELVIVTSFIRYSRSEDFWSNYEEVTTSPPESFGAIPKCGEGEQKGKFKCVPYFNCDGSTNTIVDYPEVDGSNSIEPRLALGYKCERFLHVCCRMLNTTITANVHVPAVNINFESKCGFKNGEGKGTEFPWMVALTKVSNETANIPFCGGSLLSPVVVLTAAHCVKDYKPFEIQVIAGASDLNSTIEQINHQVVNVAEIIVYKHHLSNTLYNDIALLILNNSLFKADNVGTVCLPRGKDMENINTENCFVSGWGRKYENETYYPRTLKKLPVSVITNKECQKILRRKLGEDFILDRSFICTNASDHNHTCMGDGGGPLVCSDLSQRYFQMGIVSWGIGPCGKESIPDVFTNVAQFTDWVDYKMVEIGYNSKPYTV